MPKRGAYRKKKKTHKEVEVEKKFIPKCIIIRRGKTSSFLKSLVVDLRQFMSPNCAVKLKESRHNKINDFLSMSKVYNVSHIIMLSQTEKNCYMKFLRLPDGPTLTFRLEEYSLMHDIRAQLKINHSSPYIFQTSPLLVMNGFREIQRTTNPDTFPTQLISTFFGNMFPTIDIHNIKLVDCRRITLFNIDQTTKEIYIRHYGLLKNQSKASDELQKLIQNKNSVSKLSEAFQNLSEAILCNSDTDESNDMSEHSEIVEDDIEDSTLQKKSTLALRLYEIGPRLRLKLLRIEEGILKGNALFSLHGLKQKDHKINVENTIESRKKKRLKKDISNIQEN